MIIKNFYKDKNERLKLRKRYKLKKVVSNSYDKKYVIYVYRSHKHIYLSLLSNGVISASANTIKYKKNSDVVCYRHKLLNVLTENFFESVKKFFGEEKVCVSQFLFDISYYRYSGCVKKVIDYFRQLVQDKFK